MKRLIALTAAALTLAAAPSFADIRAKHATFDESNAIAAKRTSVVAKSTESGAEASAIDFPNVSALPYNLQMLVLWSAILTHDPSALTSAFSLSKYNRMVSREMTQYR